MPPSTNAKIGLALAGIVGIAAIISTRIAVAVSAGARNYALASPLFYRPVIARMYSFNQWSLPGETPSSVGSYLGAFAPSFVSGLVRLEPGVPLTPQIIADYGTVQAAVKAVNPNCIFDLWFRPNRYTSSAAMAADMAAALSSGLQFDCFSFDNFDKVAPDFQQVAVQNAHAAGKLAMGDLSPDVLGPITTMPDAVNSSDWAFGLPPTLNQMLALKLPLMLKINNGPQPVDAAAGTEHADWTSLIQDTTPVTLTFAGGTITVTLSHQSLLTDFANAQLDNGFAWMPPGFWPGATVIPPTYWNPSAAIRALMQQLSKSINVRPATMLALDVSL